MIFLIHFLFLKRVPAFVGDPYGCVGVRIGDWHAFVRQESSDHASCSIRSAMCGSAVRARVRNGGATTGRHGTFHPSTAPSMGLMGSHSRV